MGVTLASLSSAKIILPATRSVNEPLGSVSLPSCSSLRPRKRPPAFRCLCCQTDVSTHKRGYMPPLFSVAPMMDYTDNYFRALARLLTRHAWLYTEMVVAETIVHQEKNLDKFLEFPKSQHPIVLQLGGSNVSTLAKATQLASAYEYDEINFNCGCPSDKVAGHGCFGAQLMLNPKFVGHAMAAIAENCGVPVTVKCRIGVDDADSYAELCTFVDTVASLSSTRHFIIHARKAILKGLSPAANRTIPPLKYEYVFALIRDFPHLKFTLNGGINTIKQVDAALRIGAHGVMLGRATYNSPWSTLAHVDGNVYGVPGPAMTRREVLRCYEEYADTVIGKFGPGKPSVRHLVKPLLHLFHAEHGAGLWRRAVDETLRECGSVSDLLKKTLPVIPDHVLDASPSEEGIHDCPFSVPSKLPDKPNSLNSPAFKSDSVPTKNEWRSLSVG